HRSLMKRNPYLIFALLVSLVMFASCTERTSNRLAKTEQIVKPGGGVNINTASAEELQKIPHIGPKLSAEIVAFRDRHGRFRRPEYLMLIRGFSDTRYREIEDFIRTE